MTPRVLALLVFLFPVFSGCTGVDVLSTFRTDLTQRPLDELPPIPAFDIDRLAAEHEGEPAYFFDVDRTMEHVFLLPESFVWIFVEDLRQSYVVLDPEEDRYTTFKMELADRQNLDGVFLRTTSPSGEVRTYTEADLIRDREDDKTILRFAYPAVERGTVIEEAIRTNREATREYQPPLYIDEPLQREVPVANFAFRYIYPSYWAMAIKSIGPREVPPYDLDRSTYERRTVVTFFGENLPGFPDEPFSPYFKEVAPYLEMHVTSIANPWGGEDPLYQGPTTWQEISESVSNYAHDKGGRRSYNAVRELAQSLTDGLDSDSAKVAAIVTYVQDTIEDGNEADDLSEVLRARQGNRYLRTSLGQALLNEAGIDTEYLLIHPVDMGHLDRSFITSNQFTVPGVKVTVDGEETVVFPHIEGLGTTYIPEVFQGAEALIIREDGIGRFTTVPSREASSYAIDSDYTVEIDDDGLVHVEETATLRGIAAYVFRAEYLGLTTDELEEEARELITYSEGEVDDFDFEFRNLTDRSQPLTLVLRYSIPDLVTLTPEEVIFQTGGLLSPASLSAFEVEPGTRQLPIRIHYDQLTNKTITVRYPSSWSLATELEDTATRNRFGDVRGVYTMAPGEITAEQRIFLKESRATPRSYSALLKLTGSESDLYVPTLVFTLDRGTD